MTDRERIDLKVYIGEKFVALERRLDGIDARLESLESKEDQRTGRDNFISKAAKAFATAVVTAGAAIGAYLGLKPH